MSSSRILVVDDNEINLELARCTLEAYGFAVDCATSAEHAREQLRTRLPDLILMDIQLPGTDGLEFTRELKRSSEFKHLPIIAFTAYAMAGDEQRFRAAGCDGYLGKPIDIKSFARQVAAFLEPGAPSAV